MKKLLLLVLLAGFATDAFADDSAAGFCFDKTSELQALVKTSSDLHPGLEQQTARAILYCMIAHHADEKADHSQSVESILRQIASFIGEDKETFIKNMATVLK